MARIRPETGFETTLSSGITAAATSIAVTTAPTETSGYMVIEPGTSNKEIIKYTGVSGTTLTGVTRGIALTGSSDAAGTGLAHTAGVTVSMTNVHYYMEQLVDKNENEDIAGNKRFTGAQIQVGDGSTDEDEFIYASNGDANEPFLAYDASENAWVFSDDGSSTTKMVTGGGGLNAGDDIEINASAIDYVGNQNDINAGETINGATLPVAVYQKASDNEIYACDGNDIDTFNFIGFAISNSTDGNPITVQDRGTVSGFTGLTEGSNYYVQDDKTIGTSIGTYELKVGVAISETELLIQRGSNEYIGSEAISASSASATTINDTVTLPTNGKYAIIQVTFNDVNGLNTQANLRVMAKGSTLATLEYISTAGDTNTVSAEISGNTITVTGTVDGVSAGSLSLSGTAYFYT